MKKINKKEAYVKLSILHKLLFDFVRMQQFFCTALLIYFTVT